MLAWWVYPYIVKFSYYYNFVFYFQISDDFEGYSLEMFCLPKHYKDDVESIMIPKGLICDRYT